MTLAARVCAGERLRGQRPGGYGAGDLALTRDQPRSKRTTIHNSADMQTPSIKAAATFRRFAGRKAGITLFRARGHGLAVTAVIAGILDRSCFRFVEAFQQRNEQSYSANLIQFRQVRREGLVGSIPSGNVEPA
jgi:hypothetical protein